MTLCEISDPPVCSLLNLDTPLAPVLPTAGSALKGEDSASTGGRIVVYVVQRDMKFN